MRVLILLLCTWMATAQQMTDFKYVVIPERFSVQEKPGQFDLNAITKAYFQQIGYVVLMSGQALPDDGAKNCEKLYVDVKGSSSMFITKLQVELKDCNNKIVFQSATGSDKNKNNQIAYRKALGMALKSIGEGRISGQESPPEIVDLRAAQQTVVLKETFETPVLYAQPIANGYQLIDSTPRIVLKIYTTSQEHVYSATDENTSGVFLKQGDVWVYEFFEQGAKHTRTYTVKF